jgi:thiamine-phosphate pyrophosphorylase
MLCYITDRRAFPGDEITQHRRLLEKIGEAARSGVDYIQLREKDLPARELETFAREAVSLVKAERPGRQRPTALLINSRTDIALAVGADGVHLRSDDVSPSTARAIWRSSVAQAKADAIVAVSCHSASDVARAEADGADFAVFAPVFEKKDAPGMRPAGLLQLEQACRAKIPVLALGAVTLENALSCLAAGAAGIAAIRLFQDNEIAEVLRAARCC